MTMTASEIRDDLQSLQGDLLDLPLFLDAVADTLPTESRQNLADCAWRPTEASGHMSWIQTEIKDLLRSS